MALFSSRKARCVGAIARRAGTCTRMPSKRSSCSIVPAGPVSAAVSVVADGSGCPPASTVKAGATISVIGGLDGSAEGTNSLTVPVTFSRSPGTMPAGVLLVKTNTPSDVAGSASASASGAWMKNPLNFTPVTTPRVATNWPASGEEVPAPWMAWIGDSGGSTPKAALTRPVRARSSVTLAVSVFGPTLTAPTVARNEKTLSPGVTSPFEPSSKNACAAAPPMGVKSALTVKLLLGGLWPETTATVSRVVSPAAPEAGTALKVAPGGVPVALRGAGAPTVKSARLLLVSIDPSPLRSAAVVLLSSGVGAVSEQLALP